MKILITGSQGYISRNLIKYLEKEYQVVKFDILDKKPSLDDTLKNIERRDFNTILHFGANADSQARSLSSVYFENVESTRRIAESAAKSNTSLIFASSLAVLGNWGFPLTPYAQSKKLAEAKILETKSMFPFWNVAILRLSNIFGGDEESKGNMISIPTRFVKQARSSGRIDIWRSSSINISSSTARDFLALKDLVMLVKMFLLETHFKSDIFEVGRGESVSLIELATFISQHLPSKVTFIPFPEAIDSLTYQFDTKADLRALNNQFGNLEFTDWHESVMELIENNEV
jgi:nucleoside-diphosphate-sugar epimerase